MTKYRVELTQGEREELLARVNRGSGRHTKSVFPT